MCLVAMWVSSLEKCFLGSSAHLLIGLFGVCFFPRRCVVWVLFILWVLISYHKWMLQFVKSFFWIYWGAYMIFIPQLMWCIVPTDLWTEAPGCPGGSSLQCRPPGLGTNVGLRPHTLSGNLYSCDHLLFCGLPTWQCGLNHTLSLPLLPISWWFFFIPLVVGNLFF